MRREEEEQMGWYDIEDDFEDDLDVMVGYEEALDAEEIDDFEEGFIRGYLEA